MSNAVFLYGQVAMSFVTYSLLAQRYVVPRLRQASFAAGATALLFLHCFRHMGLFYLTTAAVPAGVPAGFAVPTAYGDLASAALALLAIVVLAKHEALGRGLTWVFNVVGLLDLMLALVNALRYDLAGHMLGVAYPLPTIVVPALVVSHLLVFWLLLRPRAPASTRA